MTLYAYSLVPVLAVALLLFFTSVLRTKNAAGLSIYTLSVALWCGTLLLASFESVGRAGERWVIIGSFIVAAFLHAAYDVTKQSRYGLVWLAYGIAAFITGFGALWPDLLHSEGMIKGPLFWPSMALATVAAAVPLYSLARAYGSESPAGQIILRKLFVAGLLSNSGALLNAALLAYGYALPFGMLLVLGGLFALVDVVRQHQPSIDRKVLDRSLAYSGLAAFLSAGFLFGVLEVTASGGSAFAGEFRLGAFFLLFMAALAFEPVRQHLSELVGTRLLPGRAGTTELARALEEERTRSERAERLAEVGALVSAVAHEVRNPLGVISANLRLLEKSGADADTVKDMKEQIERASRFVEDLLSYGRPKNLELRSVDLAATVDLAFSTSTRGLGEVAAGIDFSVDNQADGVIVEADQSQILQVLIVLFDNAALALAGRSERKIRASLTSDEDRVCVAIEDSGPGISKEILPRIFEPFVTGRKREGSRPGTGLGLAIARRIVDRHGGHLNASASKELSGARFDLALPKVAKS